jgi:hypothetical protein
VNMKGILCLMTLTMTAVSDRLKPGLFASAKLPPPRNHPNVWRRTRFFVALATHLRDKTSCEEPNLHLDSTTRGKPLSPPPQEKSQLPKTFVTTVVQLDTGSTIIPKKSTREPTAVHNVVLSSIDNTLYLESYDYENQTVKVHNVKGRLHKNIQFWKEKTVIGR